MSRITENMGFVLPELSDAADITQMNENWEKLDTEITNHREDISNCQESITELAETIENVENVANIARQKAYEALDTCAPYNVYSTADLIDGKSELTTGQLYLVYE